MDDNFSLFPSSDKEIHSPRKATNTPTYICLVYSFSQIWYFGCFSKFHQKCHLTVCRISISGLPICGCPINTLFAHRWDMQSPPIFRYRKFVALFWMYQVSATVTGNANDTDLCLFPLALVFRP